MYAKAGYKIKNIMSENRLRVMPGLELGLILGLGLGLELCLVLGIVA